MGESEFPSAGPTIDYRLLGNSVKARYVKLFLQTKRKNLTFQVSDVHASTDMEIPLTRRSDPVYTLHSFPCS
jgi:hypothetical protein